MSCKSRLSRRLEFRKSTSLEPSFSTTSQIKMGPSSNLLLLEEVWYVKMVCEYGFRLTFRDFSDWWNSVKEHVKRWVKTYLIISEKHSITLISFLVNKWSSFVSSCAQNVWSLLSTVGNFSKKCEKFEKLKNKFFMLLWSPVT